MRIPARSEVNVPGRIVYRDLTRVWNSWSVIPWSPVDEVRMVLEKFQNRYMAIPVRVVKLASYPVDIFQGTFLSEFETAKFVERRQ